MRFQAEHVATQLATNGGFNCNACRVLVLHADWPQKREFLDTLRAVLAAVTPRTAYYPGAADRYAHFTGAYPQSEQLGPQIDGGLPWALIPDVPPNDDGPAFGEESFCGVVAQTALPGTDAADFLERAVDFCNTRLWGTLNASLIVHPRTERALGERLDQAVESLRYGTVVINHWAALAYAFGSTPWGAAPGHTRDDIQSGVGVVHNAYLLDNPEQTVIRGPFTVTPKPPWFVTHRTAHRIARKMVALERAPSLWRLPGIIAQALRG
jgi:hypothetical protein